MNETEPITDLLDLTADTRTVREHRRDPLAGCLLASNVALACLCGIFALVTHREWLRICDVAGAIFGVLEFGRLLAARNFD
jgi:hypothetical protein